jgi:hypothetical protein
MVDQRTSEPRAFPIQTRRNGVQAKVSERVYMAAYEVYAHIHGPQQAMIDLEGRNCRGGFGSGELIAFLYARAFPKSEWSARADEAFLKMEGFV